MYTNNGKGTPPFEGTTGLDNKDIPGWNDADIPHSGADVKSKFHWDPETVEKIAMALLADEELNKSRSSENELQFGTNGSLSIEKCVFFDHEANVGDPAHHA